MAITNPAVAVAVINEAKARSVYAGAMPETDDEKLKKGNELLTMAEEAKNAGVQADAVLAVIAAAHQEPGASSVAPNPFGGAPAAPPTPEPTPAPAPTPPPVAAAPLPEGVTIDTAIPGYDEMKVADILTAMEKLNDAGIAFVKAYEAQEGERAKIMNFQKHEMVAAPPVEQPIPQAAPAPPEAPAPASGPVFANVEPTQYETVEPWQGYKKAKIKDIMAVVESVFSTNGEAARPLLAHVWSFESANNERSSLLNKLKALAENGVQVAPPVAAPAPAPTPEPAGVVAESPFAQAQPEAPAPATPNLFAPAPTTDPLPNVDAQPVEGGATGAAQAFISNEGLPIPPQVGTPPELPADFTTLSDVEVRKLSSQFNAVQARAHYLLSISEGHANDAKIAADGLAGRWIEAQTWPAKVTLSEQNSKASNVAEIAQARHTQHEYAEQARQLKALRDIYKETCDRLSREQTGRADEKSTAR